ncbi:hypothetical protein ACTXT7_014796, partial [Hymenolepis weldensis]
DREPGNIDLVSIDWIDKLNLIQFSTLPDTYRRTYECGKFRKRMQPVPTQFSKPESPKT